MAAFEVIALDTATPQLRAPGAADTYTFPRAVEMPLGTANGVLYLNGSKVVTSGSALTFDGTLLGVGSDVVVSPSNGLTRLWGNTKRFAWMAFDASYYMEISADAPSRAINYTVNSGDGTATHIWSLGAAGTPSEQMRLTTTGLGIGTSSPGVKLDVFADGGMIRLNGTSGNNLIQASTSSGATGIGLWAGGAPRIYSTGSMVFSVNSTLTTGAPSPFSDAMTLDSSGNLGLGVTPTTIVGASGSNGKGFQTESLTISSYAGTDQTYFATNAYTTSYVGGWTYRVTAAATRYDQSSGAHIWYTAPSGTAGNTISFTQALTLTAASNLKLGGTADRATTAGTNHLDIFNGTAPVGTLANGISIYSNAGEAYVMDAAGNATLFSPHDAETNEWIFRSKHTPTGKVLKIDVERLLRFVNDHFGLDAVQEFVEA